MKSINKILLPTDFEDTLNVVLDEAVTLAQVHDAELHILHVNVFPIGVPFASTYFDPLADEIKGKIDSYADEKFGEIKTNFGDACHLVFQNRSSERVLHGIEGYVEELDIDMIIMSSHGRKTFSHFFLGSIAEEVIRHSEIPVLVVKKENSNFGAGKGKICVPVDFSDFSKEAFAEAIEFANSVDAEIHLIHVIPNMIQLHVEETEINVIKSYPDLIRDTELALKRFHHLVDPDFKRVEYKILFGVAAIEINDYVNQNGIKMLYISSHGLTGIKKFFIGNVAEKIVRMVDCPVFVAK